MTSHSAPRSGSCPWPCARGLPNAARGPRAARAIARSRCTRSNCNCLCTRAQVCTPVLWLTMADDQDDAGRLGIGDTSRVELYRAANNTLKTDNDVLISGSLLLGHGQLDVLAAVKRKLWHAHARAAGYLI